MSKNPERRVLPAAKTGRASSRRAAPEVLAALNEAWRSARRAAGTAFSRPVRGAALNQALRQCATNAQFRKACGSLVKPLPILELGRTADALRVAFERGLVSGWPALGSRRSRSAFRRVADTSFAFVLHSLVEVNFLSQAANEWCADCLDVPDDEWSDEVEQQVFSSWRAKALRRRTWPALAPEERELFVRPTIELAFYCGLYRAAEARARAARGRPWLWRYHAGRHCRRHDALDGLTALPVAPIWRQALPPLAFFCDCWIEMVRGTTPGINGDGVEPADLGGLLPEAAAAALPNGCSFFVGDRRDGPRQFLEAWLGHMRAQCADDDGEDCGDATGTPA
ncbi:MAG TPA: hypothetical protein PKB14_21935 [Rubrivivax sp.]|nr:hypothetical protein [Rubrivivax sp.]